VRAINVEGRHANGITDLKGQFDFMLESPLLDGAFLLAAVADRTLLGIYQYAYLLTDSQLKDPARIVLKPASELTVKVLDHDSNPIADAVVGFITNDNPISGGRADAAGRWTVRVPADWYQWCAFAYKRNLGFDYAVTDQRQSLEQAMNRLLPDQLTLTLDGVRTERLKAVDRDGKPISGVRVAPRSIQKVGREPFNNWLDRTSELWPETGHDGVALLDWLPRRFGEAMIIGQYADDLYALDPTWIATDKPPALQTVTFLPMASISGRVTHADGRPAVDVLVSAQGQGSAETSCLRLVRTDAAGRYDIRAESEQAYIVLIEDREWAAPYRGDILVRAGKPAVGVDFVLRRATRLHGRVIAGHEGPGVPKTAISLVIDRGEVPAEIQLKGRRYYRHVRMDRFAETDDDGRYEFLIGPGEYQLEVLPARLVSVKLKIAADNPPVEVTRDVHISKR
jgi:hypothetical protein